MMNLTFEDFPDICRLCLKKKDNLKSIEHIIGARNLFKKIICADIDFGGDFPKNVCLACSKQLEFVSSFIDLCISNDKRIREVLEKHRNEECSQEEDCEVNFSPVEKHIDKNLNKDFHKHIVNSEIKCEAKKSEASAILNYKCTKNKLLEDPDKTQFVTCEICGQHFNSRTELCNHKKKNTHCQIRKCRCSNCGKAFSTNFKLKLHLRSHTKETPYECKICSKKFRFASNVNRHVDVVHKGLKPFKCDICGKDFPRLERKIQHQVIHTNKCAYKCKYCGENFKHRSTHRNHEIKHKIENCEIENPKIECPVCKKIIFSKCRFQEHFEIHSGERKFLCSICGKEFVKKSYLDNHYRKHTEEKPFQCKECGKKFKYPSSYTTHALFHTGVRRFKCNICSKTFKQSAHLKSHFQIHTGEKPFQCNICEKKFTQNSSLKAHTRIHTGEVPYQCPICAKGFHDSSSMKKHEKAHRKKSLQS